MAVASSRLHGTHIFIKANSERNPFLGPLFHRQLVPHTVGDFQASHLTSFDYPLAARSIDDCGPKLERFVDEIIGKKVSAGLENKNETLLMQH